MRSAVLRPLALLVSLVLVAPPGWCCLASRAEAPARAAACCGCPHRREAPAPAPAPKKTPTKPFQCPCYDRQVTAPAGPTALTAAPADFTPAAAAVSPALVGPFAAAPARLSDSLLYLTHCAWRC
jgi:hypothetical protein